MTHLADPPLNWLYLDARRGLGRSTEYFEEPTTGLTITAWLVAVFLALSLLATLVLLGFFVWYAWHYVLFT